MSTDGTYKLHFVYMFVRTECEEAYWKLFDVTARSLHSFFGFTLIPKVRALHNSP
ncbi:hypothetical protein H310_12217 [Aphanomyces invadans]|uniref:Uncharacterized protein n=1 Tax=Aphanomyces invadans TaxID=157072 RepID=A0A024TIQ6_9STRA|nr:hypothetical protein H310_12217 [Aphanomyces invadans]ETV93869.1 hypothetical protein H310_12217 [Aphanomyces invadans]|eukprot:XP_008877429.1 hypothetical protein H310_12217 [Aphanomyces invadans]